MVDIGACLPNEPYWYSTDWEDVENWVLTSGVLQLNGDEVCKAYQRGTDYTDPQNPVVEQRGPYGERHIARILFRHNDAGDINVPLRALEYAWDGPVYKGLDIGGAATVYFPCQNSPDPLAGALGIITGLGGLSVPITIEADTDYVLEVEFITEVRARVYKPEEEEDIGYLLRGPFATSTTPDQSQISLLAQGTTDDILQVEQVDISLGPAKGQEFDGIFIAYADGDTDTFYGLPTSDGSVQWWVDGDLIIPKSVNEVTGEVVLDRNAGEEALIQQSGTFRV